MKKVFRTVLIAAVIATTLCSTLFLFGCNDEPVYEGSYLVKEDITFRFDNKTTVMGIPVSFLLDKEESGITLRTDGTITIKVKIAANWIDTVNIALEEGKIDLSGFGGEVINLEQIVSEVNLTSAVQQYVDLMFPGFDLADMNKSLSLVKQHSGIDIVGVDFTSDGLKNLQAALATGGLTTDFVLPEDFYIEYTGPYYQKKVSAEINGEQTELTGVFVGKHHPDSDPFVIMTRYVDDDGNSAIKMRAEFIKAYLNAVNVAE